MRATGIILLMLVLTASWALAGELYGTITDGKKPVAAGLKVDITVSGKVVTVQTDKFGGYRTFVKDKGKGTLTLHVKDQSATADLFSFDKSTRYDWILETKDGKLSLRRK